MEDEVYAIRADASTNLVVSVMGHRGEYIALALYVGGKEVFQNVRSLMKISASPDDEPFDEGLSDANLAIRQLHIRFGELDELHPCERVALRSFRDQPRFQDHLVPTFCALRKGYWMDTITAEEANWLAMSLQSMTDVFRDMKDFPGQVILGFEETSNNLPFAKAFPGPWRHGTTKWILRKEAYVPVKPQSQYKPYYPSDCMGPLMRRLPQHPGSHWDFDIFSYFAQITNQDDPAGVAVRPNTLLVMDRETGLILSNELLVVSARQSDIIQLALDKLVTLFERRNMRPASIHVMKDELQVALQASCDKFLITLVREETLPQLIDARKSLMGFMDKLHGFIGAD